MLHQVGVSFDLYMGKLANSEPYYKGDIRLFAVPTAQESYRKCSKDHSDDGLYERNNRNVENLTLRQRTLCGQGTVIFMEQQAGSTGANVL